MLLDKTSLLSKLLVAAGLAAFVYLCLKSMNDKASFDLYVYRTGSKMALDGVPPYATPLLRMRVAEQFPPEDENDAANQCGFFLPPQAIPFFLPFAQMSWGTAQVMWFFALTIMGFVAGTLAWTFGRAKERQGIGWAFVVLIVWLNPITMPSIVVGQTSLLFLGCLALGQYAFENDCPRLGCFLWSIVFIKPHIALPFFVLAWLLGGWRRAAGIALAVAVWNLLGGLIVTGKFEGSYYLFRSYIEFVSTGHKQVIYNLVELNYQIPSWNRILAASGGPAIDLKIWMTLAGFALWTLLIVVRLRLNGLLSRERLDQAYLVAVTAVGTLFFAQLLANEMLLLGLLAPLILQHLDAGRKGDAYILIAILMFLFVPLNLTDRIADFFEWAEQSRARTLVRSHKCFGMAVLGLWLLIRGPARNNPAEKSTTANGELLD